MSGLRRVKLRVNALVSARARQTRHGKDYARNTNHRPAHRHHRARGSLRKETIPYTDRDEMYRYTRIARDADGRSDAGNCDTQRDMLHAKAAPATAAKSLILAVLRAGGRQRKRCAAERR